MPIRLSGMSSGLDTESIVESLMSAKKYKKTKIENNKTKLEWKKEKWSALNKKIYSFYTGYASKFRMQGSYKAKSATSSDTSKLKVTASNSAANGSYKIKVNALASSQYVTSAKLGTSAGEGKDLNGNDISTSTKLSDLGMTTDGSTQIKIGLANGDTKTLTLDSDSTVGTFVDKLKEAGLNASYDSAQKRLFISSKESGSDQSFTITTNSMSASQTASFASVRSAMDYDNLTSEQKSSVSSILEGIRNANGEDATALATHTAELQNIMDEHVKTLATEKFTKDMTESIKDNYMNSYVSGATYDSDDVLTGGTVSQAGRDALTEAGSGYIDDNGDVTAEGYKKLQEIAASKAATDVATDANKQAIEAQADNFVTSGGTLGDVTYASQADRNSDISSALSSFNTQAVAGTTQTGTGTSPLSALGLGEVTGADVSESSSGNSMVVVGAKDSEIVMNGATLKGSSTTMTVNGLTLNLASITDSEVTVSVANDTTAAYDAIKDFISQYNSLLSELNTGYYAESAKGYNILTDEQKEAMSEDEITKWNDKIKDSLLRRDDTLNTIIQTMRDSMTGTTITASNGKKYSLANLGITTSSDYTERGLLHIKGDEDDEQYATDTNTLKSLLEEDPAVVEEVLAGITTKLYDNLTQKMRSSSLSSAFTFYNDKQMTKQLETYKTQISDWEEKLSALEDRYYKQFTAMEKAMASINSTQSSLSGYFGM